LKPDVKNKACAQLGQLINSLIKMCVNVGGYRREKVSIES